METRILVVDDDESVLNPLSLYLKKSGYLVDTATGADPALALMAENEYDILVTDKNMPGTGRLAGSLSREGGLELLRAVTAKYPSTQVIMITGFATVDSAIEAMRLGAFDYIAKPFSPSSLKKKIERIREYKASINPDNTIRIYREFRDDLLTFIEDRCNLSDPNIHEDLERMEKRIDAFFATMKQWENVILVQREALGSIACLAEQALESHDDPNEMKTILKAIQEESGKRI